MLTDVILNTATARTYGIDTAAPTDPLVIKSISGLDPGTDTLFTGEFASEGSYYQGRRSPERNLVITFKMNPQYDVDLEVSDIREMLYRDFMEPFAVSDELQVVFIDDRKPPRYLTGICEGIITDMWQKNQTAQVSIRCMDPALKSNSPISASGLAAVTQPLTYAGSKDAGLEFEIEVQGTIDEVIVQLSARQMIFEGGFVTGDVIQVNTVPRSRSVVKNGVDSMSILKAGSVWLTINGPGQSLYVTTDAGEGEATLSSYEYTERWRGI